MRQKNKSHQLVWGHKHKLAGMLQTLETNIEVHFIIYFQITDFFWGKNIMYKDK